MSLLASFAVAHVIEPCAIVEKILDTCYTVSVAISYTGREGGEYQWTS